MSITDKDNSSTDPLMKVKTSDMHLKESSTPEHHSSISNVTANTESIPICSSLAPCQSDSNTPVTKSDINSDSVLISSSHNTEVQDTSLPPINGIKLLSIDIKSDDGFTEDNECYTCDDSSDDCPNGLLVKDNSQAYQQIAETHDNCNSASSSISNDMSPSAMTELLCDTRLELKISTPDSGHSSELHESDASSSCTSNRSDVNNDFLKSPVNSEASTDCGKDYNESFLEATTDLSVLEYTDEDSGSPKIYEFTIPHDLCGLLIGKNGRYVRYIKEESNADILIKRHPVFGHLKSCAVSGNEEEINFALSLIRERFPLEKFPNLSLALISDIQHECPLPVTVKLSLPEGVTFDVILSTVVSPGHFFVHQPTHPTYHALSRLSNQMTDLYNSIDTPGLHRIAPGFIVAAPVAGGWYRAEVVHMCEESQIALVKLLDFGGFVSTPVHQLRQMRYEHSYTPFQATECFLGNVTYPDGESSWSEEAKSEFEELSRGQILQGYILGYGDCNVPFVHLFKTQGTNTLFINRELVNKGLARWIDHQESSN